MPSIGGASQAQSRDTSVVSIMALQRPAPHTARNRLSFDLLPLRLKA